MRIAVIGAGVSGLTAAYVLSRAHEVTLFEREPRLGGHAHTHAVVRDGAGGFRAAADAGHAGDAASGLHFVDTGFMVFNRRTYPNFIRLLEQLGVESRESDMSFSVRCRRCGLEYSSAGVNGLFADRTQLVSVRHWTMLADILRFFKTGRDALLDGSADGLALGAFLDRHGFGQGLTRHFLLPMGGAIWSASSEDMRQFPATSFLRFLENHGLLAPTGQPVWRTVTGGSRSYVHAIAARLDGRARVRANVTSIERDETGVEVTFGAASHSRERFDRVVIATHADEALRLLGDASNEERDALARFRYSSNATYLHTDTSLLPSRAAAHASWNCELADCADERSPVSVTYDLSRLQGHSAPVRFLCSLNPATAPLGPILAHMNYTHPILDGPALEGQRLVRALNGHRHTFYCGAHLRYGFHEDGVVSALAVTEAFGLAL